MAGKKKAKKPAANPARGFATTSIAASKTRVEIEDNAKEASGTDTAKTTTAADTTQSSGQNGAVAPGADKKPEQTLSPEEFEKQLEESELQLLVEKHAAKVKRDAQRLKTRLETDRRVLRGQSETVNSKKWLPTELMDQVLDLLQAESRFAASTFNSENGSSNKTFQEEDLTIKLWTLQQTLLAAGFPETKIKPVLQFVLDIAPNVSLSTRESVWGLDESLEWLARECEREELPDYEGRGKAGSKSQAETPMDSPLPSGMNTPRIPELDTRDGSKLKNGIPSSRNPRGASPKKKAVVTFDEDIEPDELLPAYLGAKEKLFALQRPSQDGPRSKGTAKSSKGGASDDPEEALLLAKVRKIENDVLFDKYIAEQQWREKKISLEKDFAAERKKQADEQKAEEAEEEEGATGVKPEAEDDQDEVAREAERIAAEILAENGSDDDEALAGLFASLPTNEVDPVTGKTNTVMNGADGTKTIIRDFGKFTGVTPSRALEEACRARDSGVKISYYQVSEVAIAHRAAVNITWSKPQEVPPPLEDDNIEVYATPSQFYLKMTLISTPDSKQSEAYIATTALFYIFGSSGKEEKVALRLPAAWKDLWTEYSEARKEKLDAQDRAAVKELRDLVRKKKEQELEDGVINPNAFKGRGQGRTANSSEDSGRDEAQRASAGPEYYQNIWYQKASTPQFRHMLQSRMQLPMWQFRQQVVETVDREQVVIICGETGCGKSTQTPTFLLEHQLSQGKNCKIYCTEPRRISAISLARRVSEELGERKQDLGTPRSLVGYSIRLEANTSKETRLVYATTGIVMRMLEGSNDLKEITHLVLDEVHERTIDSDFLLIVLKKLLTKRKDLKVVLMSATVDAERFSKYLGGAPVLNVPGRTFPVRVGYLEDAVELTGYSVDSQVGNQKLVDLDDDDVTEAEIEGSSKPELLKTLGQYSARTRNTLSQMDEYRIDFDLIVQLIKKISVDPNLVPFSNAILVFLPGIAEIKTLNDMLLGDRHFQENSWLVYPLHSTIATEEQENAFLVPPPGMRKIVLATNIAETGITIPDVTCVIDTGKHREMRFDERRQLSRLLDSFISRANAKQRRGRAGRVQEGLCFHLFTKYRHDCIMSDQQTPEMLRLSLQDLAIRVKICKIGGIEETLSEALDPPSSKNIHRAIDALVDVRALTQSEELTPLGLQLARLPLDVFLGKLILQGTIFKCLDMALTVAAILSSKSPFVTPFGQRGQADTVRMAFRHGDSDLLTIYNAYCAWRRICQSASGGGEYNFCRKNFLSQQTLANIEDLKGQLIVALVDSGFLSLTDEERRTLNRLRTYGKRRQQAFFELPARVNTNSDNVVVAQAVIAWSFYPKLLVRDVPGGKGLRNVDNNQKISLHPSSVNKGHNELRWLSYYNIMQNKGFLNAHETTAVDAFSIALLCGEARTELYSGVLVLDGNRARFAMPDWKTTLALKILRSRLKDMLTRAFKNPGRVLTAQHEKWLDVWQKIFVLAAENREAALAARAV